MQSEYQGHYKAPTYSNIYPYILTTDVDFSDSLPEAGPWQARCPPGMYCTDYCHIGSGWPVRAVVDIEISDKELKPHTHTCNHKTD